jgi:serine/threonine protein kinase
MLHLHSENIIHRDLAARNILLTANLDAKVSDFGLSRQKEAKEFESKTKSDVGPLKWMSPEAIKKKVYSTKSDVWSYSILMWEVIARREPYPKMDSVTAAMAVCHEDLRPTIPAYCEPVFSRLMQSCWNTDPEERPSFKEICEVLSSYDFSSSKEIVECTEEKSVSSSQCVMPFREDPKNVLKYSTMGNFEETQISTRDLNNSSVLTSYGRISLIIQNDSVNIADQTDTK